MKDKEKNKGKGKNKKEEKILILLGGFRRKYSSPVYNLYNFFSKKLDGYNLEHNIFPLIRKLRNKNLKIVALDFATSEKLKKHLIDHNIFREYISVEDDIKAQDDAAKYLRKLHSRNNEFKRISYYKGISLWGANELDIWQSFFYDIFKKINLVDNIIKNNNPSLVILSSVDIYQKILEKLSNSKALKIISKTPFYLRLKDIVYHKLFLIGVHFLPTQLDNSLHRAAKEVNTPGEPKNKPKVLFITNDDAINQLTSDIINKLSSKGKNIKFISTHNLSDICREKGIEFSQFSDYYTKEIINNLKRANQEIRNNFTAVKDFMDSNKLEYNSVVFNEFLEELFYFLYLKRYPESAILIEIIEEMIAREKPDMILLRDDMHYFGRIISLDARKSKVPTLVMQHGNLLSFGLRELYADYIAVYGEGTKDIYIKKGAKSNHIFTVGNTNFDIIHNKKFDKIKTKKELGIYDNKKIVLFGTTNAEYDFIYTKMVISSIKELDNINLIIKLHPMDYCSENIYKKILNDMNCNGIVIKNYDIFSLLNLCDVLIICESTTGSEAAIFDKPIIRLGNKEILGDRFYSALGYCEEGVAIPATDKENLKKAIMNCLYNNKIKQRMKKDRKRFIRKHLFKIDGNAVSRINGCIDRIISSKKDNI